MHTYTQAGLKTVTLTVTDDDKNSASTTAQVFASEPVPPFQFDQVGTAGNSGLVQVEQGAPAGSYCIQAGGSAIRLTADNFSFLHQTVSGDFQVTAKIDAADLPSTSTRVGLMARLSTAADAPFAMMSIDSQNDGYSFPYRKTSKGFVTSKDVTPPLDPARSIPAWIRLERQGANFMGSTSADGSTFEPYFEIAIPDLDVADLLVGLAASAGDGGNIPQSCSTLSGFTSGPPAPSVPQGLVATGLDGSVSLDWSDNPEPDLLGYDVYRDGAKVNGATVTTSAYQDAGRTNGTQYCYTVRAVGPGGQSADSDQACATPTAGGAVVFKRGDTDASGSLDITDAISLLGYLFQGGADPPCLDAADTDDSGKLDISDAIGLLSFLFQGGAEPAAPGPSVCGPDTTPSPDISKPCVYSACQ